MTISSLIDTWLVLRDVEATGERNRALYVIKSRGMQHSRQIREFLITSQGIELLDVYVGSRGVRGNDSQPQRTVADLRAGGNRESA